jgi:HEAT repeat protein
MDRDVERLVRDLRDPDRFVRRQAALALGQQREPGAVAALIDLLSDQETVWDAAGDAAWALGEIMDARAVPALIAALEKPFVRGRAIEALVKLHDGRALGPLIDLFARTPDPSVATVLGTWADPRAVEPLVRAMDSPDPHVRYYTARALGRLGDRRALPVLERAVAADTAPITDTQSLRGKSVALAAARAIEQITARQDT